ncbi:MAG: hypothetical protein Q9172_007303 [Xanthocarpia lactea]
MEDGYNEARALRITEIMTDFQALQRRIAEYAPDPSPEEYFEEGYEVLRQCRAEAQAVLIVPYPMEPSKSQSASGDSETRQLQRIILDASARRFQSKKIYLRAVAAVRWSNTRTTILQSGEPLQQQAVLLQQANTNLHAVCTGFTLSCGRSVTDAVSLSSKELAAITDTGIYYDFRQADAQAGYWLHDDPPLASILNWIRSQAA